MSLYPRSPDHVPRDLARLTPRYRRQVVLVLASLLFSLLLYLGLLVGSAWLCRWLVVSPWPVRGERGEAFLRIAGIVCSALLFLYLLKGLFKGSGQDQSLLVEITEEEQPELFAFIRQICAEARAPFPGRIYLTPEVNAAVFYHSSFLNLIFPTRKNLLIGLGLVNVLNLSEFKAVLAHEFGHFSQKSMKVGSYVYVANKVLADVIYGRDFLDDLVHKAKHLDIRIAVFVWAFLGVLWGLRKVLEGVFKAVNIFNLSLMREMEFNADRVAVSVAGSDAVVHALLRSSFADQAFRQMAGDLWSAADHGLYSQDIFRHQLPAGELLRRRTKNPRLGRPPERAGGDVQVFQPGEGDVGIPPMWQTHPSYYDREQNAKAIYIRAPLDERSSWLLFHEPAEVRFLLSQRYYEVVHKPEQPTTYVDPQTVQQFLDEEYAETTFSDRYHGLYDNRYLEVEDMEDLIRQARAEFTPESSAGLVVELDKVFGPELKAWVEENVRRLGEFDLLSGLKAGHLTLKESTLKLRDQTYRPSDVPALLDQIQKELDEDQRYKRSLDGRVFRLHWRLAHHLGRGDADVLTERYRFHLALQKMHQQIIQACQDTQAALDYAGSHRELSPEDFAQVRDILRQSVWKLFDILKQGEELRIPPLKNIPAGARLGEFLLRKEAVADIDPQAQTIDPAWIKQYLAQLAEVQDKLKRLLFKSLGGILSAQEQIARAWTAGNGASDSQSVVAAPSS